MKTKTKCGRQTWIPSRKLTSLAVLVPLFLFPLTARGDDTTNFTASGLRPTLTAVDGETSAAEAAVPPEFTLPASRDLMRNTNDDQAEIGDASAGGSLLRQRMVLTTDGTTNLPSSILPSGEVAFDAGEAGFVAARALPNSTSILKREEPIPELGASVLVLEAPGSKVIHRAGSPATASLGGGQVGKLVVRFCEPSFHPSPPGGVSDLIRGETDRPWPVISAGAATGKCWNDPAIYQAQGFLSLHW